MLLLVVGDVVGLAVRAPPCVTAVSDDGQQPRALIAPAKTGKIPPRAQIGLLHDVLRIVLIAHEMSRERIRVVDQRNDRLLEAIQELWRHGSSSNESAPDIL